MKAVPHPQSGRMTQYAVNLENVDVNSDKYSTWRKLTPYITTFSILTMYQAGHGSGKSISSAKADWKSSLPESST